MQEPRLLLRFLDKCRWCRKLYEEATPFVQIIGFLTIVGFTAGTAWAQYSATNHSNEARFSALESKVDGNTNSIISLDVRWERIDQKLDDIKEMMPRKR